MNLQSSISTEPQHGEGSSHKVLPLSRSSVHLCLLERGDQSPGHVHPTLQGKFHAQEQLANTTGDFIVLLFIMCM